MKVRPGCSHGLAKVNVASFFHAHISYLEPDIDLCLLLISKNDDNFFAISSSTFRSTYGSTEPT